MHPFGSPTSPMRKTNLTLQEIPSMMLAVKKASGRYYKKNLLANPPEGTLILLVPGMNLRKKKTDLPESSLILIIPDRNLRIRGISFFGRTLILFIYNYRVTVTTLSGINTGLLRQFIETHGLINIKTQKVIINLFLSVPAVRVSGSVLAVN